MWLQRNRQGLAVPPALKCCFCLPWMWHPSCYFFSLCSDIQSKACGLIGIIQRKWDMGLTLLSCTPIWNWYHFRLLSVVTCNDFWWKWEGKKKAWIVLDLVYACSLNIVWTYLTSRHFDLGYDLHFYAYISSCALSVLSKCNRYYYYYFSTKSLIQ